MAESMDYLTDTDVFDDIISLQDSVLELANIYCSEEVILSESSQPTFALSEDLSHDIPINPKEWLVMHANTHRLKPPHLFEFLLRVVQHPVYASYASYSNKSEGIFQVHKPKKIADLWEKVKSRQANQPMTYENFARAIRWYYPRGIMLKTNLRHTFRFSLQILNAYIIDENDNRLIFCSKEQQ
ncbi:unnamed protein product [Adineta steineri]|uniref:ETS domain-containing protein n=1 Tax=Adineta steineri TaxID=433720 RepID=A0A814W6Q0_9BILA|nr:unnamed protein product [Adineta steineri]CAF1463966.1 unnamed protein product [Adineta steineri]